MSITASAATRDRSVGSRTCLKRPAQTARSPCRPAPVAYSLSEEHLLPRPLDCTPNELIWHAAKDFISAQLLRISANKPPPGTAFADVIARGQSKIVTPSTRPKTITNRQQSEMLAPSSLSPWCASPGGLRNHADPTLRSRSSNPATWT